MKAWRLEQLAGARRQAELDPLTEVFVLAWDAFEAPQGPYDEALRLARVVGADLDRDVIKAIAEKKASDIVLWDSGTRAAKGRLGPADGRSSLLDALHHAGRTRSLAAAKEMLETAAIAQDPAVLRALEAVLEVLPPSRTYTGLDPTAAAGGDFEALEGLRHLAYDAQVDEPEQLSLWRDEAA